MQNKKEKGEIMIKKYKMTRTVRNVEVLQLKENNIMEMARFLNSGHFFANGMLDGTNNIDGVSFYINSKDKNDDIGDWELELDFGDYAIKVNEEIEAYSEKEFKQLFTEEK